MPDDAADDTTDEATDSSEPDGATADDAACAALVDFNAAASDEEADPSTPEGATELGTTLEPLWADATEAVPESSQDDAATITAAIADLKAGDATAFQADDTFTTCTAVVAAAIEPCGFTTASVTATEGEGTYAFEDVPDTFEAGSYSFTLKNEGAEDHVFVVWRKNDGETRSAEELLALPEEEGQAAGTEAGGVFASPGAEGSGLVELTPGDYVYFCPIPIGGQDGPPHFSQGMFGEFKVS